ncbi:ATP-binding protein [Sphingosinicella sp. BN140058]|uniref:ATP-binding protein n=1 Tax=Sphingosinicella sp. BN140058 TaxID=1892855 RepID=UPI00101082C3|nr:ATP-binding protein [Sphingosinicella sp. BN140058]QAY79290.1 response regulator [Sphingosinicella sp. BN140058]
MFRFARFARRWPKVPVAAALMALVLLAVGLAVIFQSDRAYGLQKIEETRVQAEILAASVTPALDFGDAATAREAANALGVNPQIAAAGIYNRDGSRLAGFERQPGALPARLAGDWALGGRLVQVVVPVVRERETIGSVYLSSVREPTLRRLARYSVVGLLVIMAVLVVLVLGFTQVALRRANWELEARADALSAAYAELQVQVEERTRAEDQLRQSQKMQALGQLTGGIAHDFNNLLTVIQGSADMLRRPGLAEARRVRYAEAIVQTAGRAAALTSQLLAFARRQPLRAEVIDLNQHLEGMADLLDRTLGERVKVEIAVTPGLCPIEADPAQLESAILNIAVNARDAMPDGGTLTLRTAQAEPLEDGRTAVALAVSDTGSGIPADVLARVFEPFFTTKDVGRGTGLGLSQVYGFAAQSGGIATLDSEVGVGTTVTLVLPCTARDCLVPAAAAPERARSGRTGTILVVDDNDEVGLFAETLLTELGHEVVRASSGAQAIERLGQRRFDIVFTDVVMPGMSGLELAARAQQIAPASAVILTTGYSDEITRTGTNGLPVVFKPYRLDTLAEMIDGALAAGATASG